jgi:hypothetical protein
VLSGFGGCAWVGNMRSLRGAHGEQEQNQVPVLSGDFCGRRAQQEALYAPGPLLSVFPINAGAEIIPAINERVTPRPSRQAPRLTQCRDNQLRRYS